MYYKDNNSIAVQSPMMLVMLTAFRLTKSMINLVILTAFRLTD